MRKAFLALFVGTAIVMMMACGADIRAKYSKTNTPPTSTPDVHDLPPQQKLVTVTWCYGNPTYLTRPMRAGEAPEVYTLLFGGRYEQTIVEHGSK